MTSHSRFQCDCAWACQWPKKETDARSSYKTLALCVWVSSSCSGESHSWLRAWSAKLWPENLPHKCTRADVVATHQPDESLVHHDVVLAHPCTTGVPTGTVGELQASRPNNRSSRAGQHHQVQTTSCLGSTGFSNSANECCSDGELKVPSHCSVATLTCGAIALSTLSLTRK